MNDNYESDGMGCFITLFFVIVTLTPVLLMIMD